MISDKAQVTSKPPSDLSPVTYQCESRAKNRPLGNLAEEISRHVFGKILLCQENVEAFRNDTDRIDLFEKGITRSAPGP